MSVGDALYFDTSALVKLVVKERESASLDAWLQQRPRMEAVSSSIARTELRRAVMAHQPVVRTAAVERLRKLRLVATSDRLLEEAGQLGPARLRSLDAIHLATARRIGPRLQAVITYDLRMIEAAKALGMPVAHPGLTA